MEGIDTMASVVLTEKEVIQWVERQNKQRVTIWYDDGMDEDVIDFGNNHLLFLDEWAKRAFYLPDETNVCVTNDGLTYTFSFQ